MSKTGVVATIFSTRFASAVCLRPEAVSVVGISNCDGTRDFPVTMDRSNDFTRQRFRPPHPDTFAFALKRRRVRIVSHDFVQFGSGQLRLLFLEVQLGELNPRTRVG